MGSETLVIASSHSGETEEVLSAFERALAAGTKAMAITTGGTLGERAQAADAVLWTFDHNGAPRAAVGYSFALLLAALTRLALIPDPSSELQEAVRAMREQEAEIGAQVAVVHNPAKRMAGQLVGRMPTFIGADILAPVARRWCTQVNELAKAAAHFGFLPEVDHNLVAGVSEPQELLGRSMVVFLQGTQTHPRDQVRVEVTREALMLEGLGTDVVTARGESRLAQQWTSLHFGDYTAFYLAMSYGVDPSPVDSIETLKGALRRRELDGE
jgi:glucose/mannose-6-phosphate isomerase